ncbi:MAG: phosphatase PAP2 family protein [Anaerolineae bacterium]|nr:phosphatase PAP2 family protein [Phycisphaerae bacterium]
MDLAVARAMHAAGFANFVRTHLWLRDVLTAPGWFGFTALVAAAVACLHPDRLRAGLFIVLTTASAALNEPIKWLVGRTRPYKLEENPGHLAPFELHPLSFAKNLCFPSGHATLAFATAAALGILWPRWQWLWYSIAGVVAVERFAENAHWLSDTVAGAALGIGGAHVFAWLLKSWKINLLTSRS